MHTILAISREYGQAPAWWHSLDRSEQALLLADYEARQERR